MAQPQWITPAGDLGTIPEGIFYRVAVSAQDPDATPVKYMLIAGQLPDGIQVTTNGVIEGTPKPVLNVQGVPAEVSRDVTSRFAIRAYTTRVVNGQIIVDRLADRTFSLTVTGQDVPEFVTPAGNIGTFYDGTEIAIQLTVTDPDPNERLRFRLAGGRLPPGVTIDPRTGLIAGVIQPLVGPDGTAQPGFSATEFDQYPFDFSTRAASTNFQFTVEITDGKENNLRTFEIYVYARDSMSADTTDFTADNTFITADASPTRVPLLLTPAGSLGVIRADNFYAFKFEAIDFDGDPIQYTITTGAGQGFDSLDFDQDGTGFDRGSFSLPPGLVLNQDTGWLYGYIPDQGATEFTYRFAIRVYKTNQPTIISGYYFFTMTITGDIDTQIEWLTNSDLGTVVNGSVSTLAVEAVNVGGRELAYRLAPGTASCLPQGLELMPTGHIVGRVSFNTFALDGGTTTFDKDLRTRLNISETTFDLEFNFTVNAYAPATEQQGYQIGSIRVTNGGSGYVTQPTVTISAPPNTADSVQATAGVVTIQGGQIIAIAVGNPGRGYTSPPSISITGGGGIGATAGATVIEVDLVNAVSVVKTFTVSVSRLFNEPYESLYIKAMPPQSDRDLLNQLLQNQDIIPVDLVYRDDDPNFGVSSNVKYVHAFGLTASTADRYIEAMQINHYWKNLVLGQIKSARALDSSGNVLYEVIYSEVIDDLVNALGQSVDKSVTLSYPVTTADSVEIDTVYPNSLINMRDQIINNIGQVSPALPLWMTSKQTDGRVLGFVPAWVIAYVKPGESGRVIYNIQQKFGQQLNLIDFEVDRYELDRSQTYNWMPYEDSTQSGKWIPSPPLATTFDTVSRPSNLRDRGLVDYATKLAYVDINWRPLSYIASLGGIDGDNGPQLNGRTLIFLKQENFTDLTPDQAFENYPLPYDNALAPYDDELYDEGAPIPTQQRLAVYRITVTPEGLVTLSLLYETQTYDYVTIFRGTLYRRLQWYLPNSPNFGELLVTWSPIPEVATTPTIFDGGCTTFITPADRWTDSDEFDKYLVFPQQNILG